MIGLCKLLHCAYYYLSGIGHYHYYLQIVRQYITYKKQMQNPYLLEYTTTNKEEMSSSV